MSYSTDLTPEEKAALHKQDIQELESRIATQRKYLIDAEGEVYRRSAYIKELEQRLVNLKGQGNET